MSEIKLFQIKGNQVAEIYGEAVTLEKSLQTLIENNLETFVGAQFLATEYKTSKPPGRIDTLGIDENYSPVIIEYKRTTNENVVNQGLFYLDWLMDHRADFKLLVLEKLGKAETDKIDWSGPRLICIAHDFNRYDINAVQQMGRNIDLIRYRRFGEELLAFELVHRISLAESLGDGDDIAIKAKGKTGDKPVVESINDLNPSMRDIYEASRAYLLAQGDDVTEKITKLYVAFRRIKNFACVTVQKASFAIYLKIDPDTLRLEEGFARDVRTVGHWGTGDLEVTIKSMQDFEKAKSLLDLSYRSA